ncbi:MAG: p-hydroxycinnamoyl CoA hydratase/lyase [Thaumarchaeota archaeon]|nr:p-hydroxycinnamoyl CoA hydratase/lyase [Nitrososphaerota archaeon]
MQSEKYQFKTIKITNDDGIVTLTFNRPEKRNAMNPTMHHEMVEALEELTLEATQGKTRVLILTGAGDESFTAGQDVKEYFYDTANDPVARMRATTASYLWRHRLLRYFPAPTIAMINGYCFGGGTGVALTCDLAVAADEATIGLSEINWGIMPGGVIPKEWPTWVSFRDCLYYAFTGETFNGKQAENIRFVNFSVPRSQLKEFTWKIASKIREKDPEALRATKEAFIAGQDMNYEQIERFSMSQYEILGLKTGGRWKKGVEQFITEKKYRPGFETFNWEKEKRKEKEKE